MGHRSIGGKPIRDASEPLTIHVTRKNVRDAKKRAPMTCAIARGLTKDSHVVSVRVGLRIALVEFKKEVVRYGLKPDDSQKIRAFDIAGYFKPDHYTLVPPKIKLGIKTRDHRNHGKRGQHVSRKTPMRHVWRVKETQKK